MTLLSELREALKEIARQDVGGMQGIDEEHRFDPTDYSPEDAYDRLQKWRDEEVTYLIGRVSARQSRARSALALIDAATGEDEWQPIETAPRDGSEILVAPGYNFPVMIGKWREFEGGNGGFCFCAGHNLEPTHWRPLPAPPALSEPGT